MRKERPLRVVFFRTDTGNEPVRDWLKGLSKEERKTVGADILTVQYAWPVGRPLVDHLGRASGKSAPAWGTGLREHCSSKWTRRLCCCTALSRRLKRRLAISWAWRKNERNFICKIMSMRIHRGSNLRDFLKEEGILEEVEERAVKQALALQIRVLLKENELTKAELAARMKTSRTALDRLLDGSNTSVTLATLGKAARALKRKIKIELVPA